MKHSKKKIVSAVIAIGVLTSAFAVVASAADETAAPTATPAVSSEQVLAEAVRVNGTVTAVGEDSITVEDDSEDAAYSEIVLNISSDTALMDYATGKKAEFTDLKKGDQVIAYTSSVMTKSLPPQSNAMVVLRGVPEKAKDNVTYAKIKSSTRTDKGYFVETDQKLILNVSDATELSTYGSEDKVTPDAIAKDMQVLAWYETVSETSPKQTDPSRVVIIPAVEKPDDTEDTTPSNPDGAVDPLAAVRVYGTVTEMTENSITLQNDNKDDALNHVVVLISEETVILDPVTGDAKTMADIKENDSITAYVGPAMTMSIPPQSTAAVVFTAPPADFAVPTYAKITNVTKDEKGAYTLETDQNVVMYVNEDTEIVSYLTKDIVTAEDLVKGSQIIAWYDIVATSEPAQAAPTKIMLLAKGEDEPTQPENNKAVIEASVDGITINGTAVALTESETPYMDGDTLMVPLRKFAEALGCEVLWDGENIMITVKDNGAVLYKIKGNTTTVTDTAAVTELEKTAAITDNGVTFTAFSDMLKLHDAITK